DLLVGNGDAAGRPVRVGTERLLRRISRLPVDADGAADPCALRHLTARAQLTVAATIVGVRIGDMEKTMVAPAVMAPIDAVGSLGGAPIALVLLRAGAATADGDA